MSKNQRKLVLRATKKFGRIRPCGNRMAFSECFSLEGDRLLFWYNALDGSTHLEINEAMKDGHAG
jgi:hypothetical protein